MNKKKKINLLAAFVFFAALLLAGHWFGWELIVVIYLAFLGYNLEKYNG
jgi:hypothetical protein